MINHVFISYDLNPCSLNVLLEPIYAVINISFISKTVVGTDDHRIYIIIHAELNLLMGVEHLASLRLDVKFTHIIFCASPLVALA
jgi:hypothetical protein